jgi:hypothetical protein
MALDGAIPHDDGPPREMGQEASRQPVINAQWALWGKEATETGAHILRCSTGPLRTKDFAEVITRYSPGGLDVLPQYTISWIPDANREPEYVALGIHELAPTDPARADGRSQRDAAGRAIVFVRLFCVRYADLAKVSVGYQDLVQAADQVQLPLSAAGRVPLILSTEPAPILKGSRGRLAARVAVLMLTGHPVCVVGADDASAAERLRFIDTAMAWLPYGLRATMSAGTWADGASQDLKLRLFFAGVPRSPGLLADGRGSSGDWVVDWGDAKDRNLSGGGAPQLYQGWLKEDAGDRAPTVLAAVTRPERFSPSSAVGRMIGTLPGDKGIAETLHELSPSLIAADRPAIRTAVRRLERYVAGEPEIEPADVRQYRQLIRDGHLLAIDNRLYSQLRGDLYDTLIRLAFFPLSYHNYCEIEDCIGASPDAPLRTALGRCGSADILPWILVHYAPRSDKWLVEFHDENNVHTREPLDDLIGVVAAGLLREEHGPVVLDAALRYLSMYSTDPGAVLAFYGYLTVEHEYIFPDRRVQAERLSRVLSMCFVGKLSRSDIDRIYDHPGCHPTAALEDAVASMTDGKNRGYIRHRAHAAVRRSQGLPPDLIPAGSKWSRWLRPWRWRQNRDQSPAPGSSQPLAAAASDEPGTVPYERSKAPVQRNRSLSSDSVWAHPKLIVAVLLLLVLFLAALFLYVVSHPISA